MLIVPSRVEGLQVRWCRRSNGETGFIEREPPHLATGELAKSSGRVWGHGVSCFRSRAPLTVAAVAIAN